MPNREQRREYKKNLKRMIRKEIRSEFRVIRNTKNGIKAKEEVVITNG